VTNPQDNSVTVAGLVTQLSQLSSLLLSMESVDRVVWTAAQLAVHSIDEVNACGVTIFRDGSLISLMPECAVHSSLEELQYANSSGPIIDVLKAGRTIVVSDMQAESRWTTYPAEAVDAGVQATAVLPLSTDEEVIGAITLYSREVNDFSTAMPLAELIAELAATALCCMTQIAKKATLNDQLKQALESRAVIDQAKGMIMMQRRCSDDEAFGVLRRTSQRRNVKLREVAMEIVASVSGTG
jgi:AmiR/NasT family two-component response regulator